MPPVASHLYIVLVVLALAWGAWHLNWQNPGEAAVLEAPLAKERAGQRMAVSFPQGTVAVNTATVEELCQLRGVGTVQAEAIIAEREANGAFTFPEDLLNVKGIGPKKLADMMEQIRLD